MNERTLRVLEFEKIVRMVEGCTSSELGAKRARALVPHSEYALVKELQDETEEAKRLIESGSSLPFGGMTNVEDQINLAQKGMTLQAYDLLAIANTIVASRKIKKVLQETNASSYPALYDIGKSLVSFQALENSIFHAISESGEIMDSASPELKIMRHKIKTLNNRIKDALDQVIKSSDVSKYLQDNVVSLRDGRFVVPVRAEHKNQVPGIVHDQSSSGATVFIEPMSVVNANNDLRQAIVEEENEVFRILTQLTLAVGACSVQINATLNCLSQLDFIFARAKLANEMNCSRPILNDKGIINLKTAKHPLLLQRGNVVSIDPRIGRDFDVLIITGPNTGGKTVTLKTIGLITLMAQSGLMIPAESGSEVSIFTEVYADIGDEQSIEQNLSTFSSHMTNIVSILNEADDRSLVLLDELGAGTDPQEGAAIAMAILSHLHKKGSKVVATTHYSELKVFAHTTKGMKNASVEFDVMTLKPTYKLSIGVPGASNAFSIAKKLGLSKEILDKASGLVDVKDVRVEEMINTLRTEYEQAQVAREDAEALRRRYQDLKDKYEKSYDKIKTEKTETLKKIRQSYDDTVWEYKRKVEDLIKELKDKELTAEQAAKEAKKGMESLRTETLKNLEGDEVFEERIEEPIKDVKIGDEVEVRGFSTDVGKVVAFGTKNTVVVAINSMKVTVPVSSLRYAPKKSEHISSKVEKAILSMKNKSISVTADSVKSASSELDLRGMRVDEALDAVDKFLDTTTMANITSARIIHGKGTGALRQAIKDMLKGDKRLKSHKYADANDGGDGVTIVTF